MIAVTGGMIRTIREFEVVESETALHFPLETSFFVKENVAFVPLATLGDFP